VTGGVLAHRAERAGTVSVMADPERKIRVGTEEREAAIRALGDHLSTGHLDIVEYGDRVDLAVAAQTTADLDALFVDLPGPHQRRPPTPVAQPYWTYPVAPPPHAPYGLDGYGRPLSDKSKIPVGVLQLVLPFGVGRLYAGHTGVGVAQLLLSVFCGVGVIWSFIDGVLILVQGGTDGDGRQLRS